MDRRLLDHSAPQPNLNVWQEIIRHSDVAISVSDPALPDAPLIFVNAAFERLTGYSSAEVVGHNCRFLQGALRDQPAIVELRTAISIGQSCRVLLKNFRKDGSPFWNDLVVTPVRDDNGSITHYFSMCSDATSRTRTPVEFEREKNWWFQLLDNSSSLMLLIDARGNVTYRNATTQQQFGKSGQEIVGLHWSALVDQENVVALTAVFDAMSRRESDFAQFEIRVRKACGQWGTFLAAARNLLDHPDHNGIIISAQEITHLKAVESQLLYDANHDALTALPNRRGILDLAEIFLRSAPHQERSTPTTTAFFLIDLDHFKNVNDSLGHAIGDDLLIAVAGRLKNALPKGGHAGRLGGDEFLIVAQFREQAEVATTAERLLSTLRLPYQLADHIISESATVGIALSPEGGTTASELLRSADIALYEAKAKGRNAAALYRDNSERFTIERLEFRSELARAVKRSDFLLHYQPIVDTANDNIIAHEALLRWSRGNGGAFENTQRVVDELEKIGLTGAVTHWAIEHAAREISIHPKLKGRVNINVWPRVFRDPDFCNVLLSTLARYEVRPDQICLEITEGGFVQIAEQNEAAIRTLDARGVKFSIDDFGKGFSNFGYLTRFPVSEIKIDREFTSQISVDPRMETLIRGLIRLSAEMGIKVVAEGVETAEQSIFLSQAGCAFQQGYYFGRPQATFAIKSLRSAAAL